MKIEKLKLAGCYDANHSSHDWPMMNNTVPTIVPTTAPEPVGGSVDVSSQYSAGKWSHPNWCRAKMEGTSRSPPFMTHPTPPPRPLGGVTDL